MRPITTAAEGLSAIIAATTRDVERKGAIARTKAGVLIYGSDARPGRSSLHPLRMIVGPTTTAEEVRADVADLGRVLVSATPIDVGLRRIVGLGGTPLTEMASHAEAARFDAGILTPLAPVTFYLHRGGHGHPKGLIVVTMAGDAGLPVYELREVEYHPSGPVMLHPVRTMLRPRGRDRARTPREAGTGSHLSREVVDPLRAAEAVASVLRIPPHLREAAMTSDAELLVRILVGDVTPTASVT